MSVTMATDGVVPDSAIAGRYAASHPLPALIRLANVDSATKPILKRRIGPPSVMSRNEPHRLTLDMAELGVVSLGEGNIAATTALTFSHTTTLQATEDDR